MAIIEMLHFFVFYDFCIFNSFSHPNVHSHMQLKKNNSTVYVYAHTHIRQVKYSRQTYTSYVCTFQNSYAFRYMKVINWRKVGKMQLTKQIVMF